MDARSLRKRKVLHLHSVILGEHEAEDVVDHGSHGVATTPLDGMRDALLAVRLHEVDNGGCPTRQGSPRPPVEPIGNGDASKTTKVDVRIDTPGHEPRSACIKCLVGVERRGTHLKNATTVAGLLGSPEGHVARNDAIGRHYPRVRDSRSAHSTSSSLMGRLRNS